jgi:diguanylate cyclase (GGDEF)-like protein
MAFGLHPIIGDNVSPVLLIAVLFSAWFGGLGPGLLAGGLGLLAYNYFFQEPVFSLAIASFGDAVQLFVFGLAALMISWLTRSRQSALLGEAIALHRALHDPLTGLPNRTLLEDRLEQALGTSRREARSFAVMILDLDGFKAVNDSYGHQAGDLVLEELAARLRRCLRESDTLARLAGDEFAVLLPTLHQPSDAVVAARKLLEALREPVDVGGRPVVVGGSLGVAVFPNDGDNAVSLIGEADRAMYAAKRGGTGYSVGRWAVGLYQAI